MTPKDRIEQTARDLGLTLTFEFIPWSQSRNRDPSPSLNWRVTLRHDGPAVLATEFTAGIAHCPFYRAASMHPRTWLGFTNDAARIETETGYRAGRAGSGVIQTTEPINPEVSDVLYSLVSDSEALDYPSFEAWADALGCDDDSREAERVYRACLDVGLKLRAAIGDAGLTRLREACADY